MLEQVHIGKDIAKPKNYKIKLVIFIKYLFFTKNYYWPRRYIFWVANKLG